MKYGPVGCRLSLLSFGYASDKSFMKSLGFATRR